MSNASKQRLLIGRRLVVCPSDRCDPPQERIPIYLGRARAFGSGLHETTVSCLEELENMAPLDNMSVLDVGCGTGILAIGALLLGAERAVAFDIDPEAAAACGSNAKLNGVHDQVDIFCGGFQALAAGTGFDLILANIYGDIILDLARGIAGKLNSDGTVILSGIAYEHMTDVRKAFENLDLKQTTNRLMDEYVTMTWVKSAPRSL